MKLSCAGSCVARIKQRPGTTLSYSEEQCRTVAIVKKKLVAMPQGMASVAWGLVRPARSGNPD